MANTHPQTSVNLTEKYTNQTGQIEVDAVRKWLSNYHLDILMRF